MAEPDPGRLRAQYEEAERLVREAQAAAEAAAAASAAVPPRGWATPGEDRPPPAFDVAQLTALVESLRGVVPPDLAHQLAEALRQGEVDVVVVALPFDEAGCVTQPMYDEPFLVAVPIGHPWEKRKQISAEELKRESLLLLGEGHCLRDQVLEFCGPVSRSGRSSIGRSLQGGSLETIRQMVASGVGVTVLPSTSVSARAEASELIRIRPFARPVPRRRVAIAWRRSYPRPQAIEALREAILACDLPQVARID